MSYSFAKKQDIEAAIRLVRRNQQSQPSVGQDRQLRQTYIFQTPAGGIAARSGTTCSSASCTAYYVDDGGALTVLKDRSGANMTYTVYHIGEEAITGSTYIQASFCYGVLVAHMEDCG